eukprot:m.198353 g.198353  ORF g.198353 m.198353 type:complete len:334 (-) comp18743_c0_seq3:431-1432(-)
MFSIAFFVCASVGITAAAEGPCDIFATGGTPCVAAHSTVRALFGAYNGPLYQVRAKDGSTQDIHTLAPGGFADSATQDTFCKAGDCVISKIYDQSPEKNDLSTATGGGNEPHPDAGVNASADRLTIGGHPVYSAYFENGDGYRIDNTTGIATGDEAETIYMVTSGTHYNNRCCFDYGNAETDNHDDGAATMEAVYFGNAKGGLNHGGAGAGPWIMADMEQALWGANVVQSNEEPINHTFVTAMIKGDSGPSPGHWAIKGANAQEGVFKVYWAGPRAPHYAPMKKQGAIILGIGGDNSNRAVGTFYEGAMTKGYSTDEADAAVQQNIVAAGYGK